MMIHFKNFTHSTRWIENSKIKHNDTYKILLHVGRCVQKMNRIYAHCYFKCSLLIFSSNTLVISHLKLTLINVIILRITFKALTNVYNMLRNYIYQTDCAGSSLPKVQLNS